MKKQQSGFTLIELVVVIVILGILAATAIPRFTDLSNDARISVAQGVAGAISSTAVLKFGEKKGPSQLVSIFNDTAVSSNESVFVSAGSTGYVEINGLSGGEFACSGDTVVKVSVASTSSAMATTDIPSALCSG